MPEIINWNLMKHPINWVTVTLMVLIFGIAIHLVLGWQTNPTSKANPAA